MATIFEQSTANKIKQNFEIAVFGVIKESWANILTFSECA